MDNVNKLNTFFNKKAFKNYAELVMCINVTFHKNIDGNNISFKNETIKLLMLLKEFLCNGKNIEIYVDMVNGKLHQKMTEMMKVYIDRNDIELFRSLLSCVITITDNSETMCEEFSKTDLPFLLVEQTHNICNKKTKFPNSVKVEDVVAQLILIVHNIARHNQCQQSFLQLDSIADFKSCLLPFFVSKDKRMCILTMSVLVWLTTDDKNDRMILKMHKEIVSSFIEYINKGMRDKNRWCEGLHVWELLLVLQALANLDSVPHEIFMHASFISMVINILKSKTSKAKEIDIAIDIIISLSFDAKDCQRLIDEYKIWDAIKVMVHREERSIRDKAQKFMWIMDEKWENKPQENREGKAKYDIFISYCHAQSAIILALANELKNMYNIWIDVDGIKGCGMDDMAHGIEQSGLLIMAVSHSYKQSPCCKLEACWANQLRKPIIPLIMEHKYKPTGWLGMMISGDTYIDVTDKDIRTLAKQINEHMKHKLKVGDK